MAAAPMPTEPTDLELDYRAKNYQDSEAIERKQIACATCGKNLSAKLDKPGGVFIHPFMSTLQCKKCSDFYGDGDFSMDEDGDDKYCRMCGNGGELYICGNKPCPYGFCQKCIDRYIGLNSSEVQADDWNCLHCNSKPLWEVRAVCAVIILENSRKRRKQRTKSTRGDVSNDDCSRSRDLDDEFKSSKRVNRRPLRSRCNLNSKTKVLEKLSKICDNSDNSLDLSDPLQKFIPGETDLNTRSKHTDSIANQNAVAKKNAAESTKRGKEFSQRLSSSEDDTSDFEEKQVNHKKKMDPRVHNASAEPESKSAKQQNNQTSKYSLNQNQRTVNLSLKHPRTSKSPETLNNPTNHSDTESSNESANDFVKSRKKNKKQNLKTQKEKSNKEDSTIQKKKSNKSKSMKFEKVIQRNKTCESSLESKHTNRRSSNSSEKYSTRNTISKKTVKSKRDASESDEEMNDLNKCASWNEEAEPCASGENKRYIDSEDEENEEDENSKVYTKVSTSTTTNRESDQVPQTKRLSTKPLCLTSQASFSLDYDDEFLDRKKAMIKRSYAKLASTKDCVTKDEAKLIKNHVGSLMSEIKMFGKSVYTGANVIANKHLTGNVRSVPDVLKTVLKCALLMIRCKKSLNIIEHEFIESYENWCQSAKVKSILSDMANTDVATSNEVNSIIEEEASVKISKNDSIRQGSEAERNTDNSAENSDASNDDKYCTIRNKPSLHVPSPTHETSNVNSDVNEKSVDASENSYVSESTEKLDKDIGDPAIRDSDEDLRNPRDDTMSDCDSKEIFSEDESGGKTDTACEPVTEKISTSSSPSSQSTKQLIESDFEEHEKADSKNLEKTRKKSSQSDNEIESPKNVSGNDEKNEREKIIECAAEKSTEKPSRDERYIENTHSSFENVFDNSTASDIVSTPNLDKEAKRLSSSDHSITIYSETMENPSVTEKSAPQNTETARNSLNDIQMNDNEQTVNFCDRLSANEQKSEHISRHDNKLKTSVDDLLPNGNENVKNISDCDTSMIFTQLPSGVSTTNSDENHVPKSNDPVENLGATKDTNMSDSEIRSDGGIPLQNDDNCKDDVVSPSKENSHSPEIISKVCIEADNPDTNKKLDLQNSSKSYNKGRKNGIIIKNRSAIPLMDNEDSHSDEGIGAVDEAGRSECEKKETTTVDDESEEAIKKKILESDSDSSDESTAISNRSNRSNSFELKVNSDSEEYKKELVFADIAKTEITSDVSDIVETSKNFHIKIKKCGINLTSPSPTDIDISELNNRAKHRLLSSSSSSSSDTDDISLTLLENLDNLESHSTSSRENNENNASSVNETAATILNCSKAKRKKFNVEKNYYYKTDKKLQMICEVVVRRLNEKVLDEFRQLLGKSKERQESEDFKSLVDLNNIKKRKRGTIGSSQSESSTDSSSSSKGFVKKIRSKQIPEKEETLLDHLEKMKNGENYCNPSGDDTDENNDIIKNLLPDDQDEFLTEANKLAKDLLIQSSDSENEIQTLIENAEEQESQEEPEAETHKENEKDISNEEEAVDSESNHENGSDAEQENEETANVEENVDLKENEDSNDSERTRERKKMKEGLAQRNWRLTDSDSSDEEKKWNKSQLKKSDEKRSPKNEDGPKNKKKVKRRVLGSDSDSVKLTDLSDSSVEMLDEKKSGSSASEDSSEIFKNLRKKRRRKRNAAQKSDSDSDSDQDEKPSKLKRKRIKKMESDSDSDNDTLTNSQDTPGKLHRKNIRKVLKDKQVADVTKIAGKEEEERLRRIAERQKLYNEMYEMKLATEAKVDKLVLDFDEETKKELISVHEDLVKRLKPHQAQGIKFMWDACFESLERIKSTKGSGCIVAHCMGLGKTFQVVTLAHTLLTHAETGIKTIMVICPLSTVLNWVNEFKKWLGDINNDEDVEVFEMTKMKKNFERKYQLEKWKRAGGVMVLGYEMFRLLSNQTGKKMRKSLHEGILKCLVDPGPDLIVCDEGHLLKNEDTALSKAMRRVKTLRRIVLTGTPLQNNLVEYHCMVQFVKPNLLGTKKEFLNRFVNPITNGQFDDSTEYDVKLMKKRAHVLHKMLEGSVQRFDYSVLTPFLPPKQEYVITVRLADIQIKLYQYYLDNLSRKKVGAGTSLFADFQALQRIWTHPIVLRMNAEKVERLNEKKRMDASDDSEGSLRDFLDDGSEDKTTSSDDSDVQSAHSSSEEKTEKPEKPRRGTRANPIDPATAEEEEEELPQSGEWWSQFVEPEHFEDLKISSKLVLLFAILKECEQIGDKVLVFSQSLYALSLIEEFLNKIDDETQRGTSSELIDGHSGSWSLGLDYFRLDGQTPPENRSHYCKIFNNPKNSRARLFLISTRAGGLGINLTAANRVIIFDASWNPSHDVQSIFRIYRFGQKKPCYVYRFLAQGTMEEKIYNRQVTKLSLSCRVVDEQQIERHYSNHDLAELYQFEPNTSKEKPTLNLPKDRLLAEIFRKYEDRIETFHEHDSLLENKAEEELDEEERKEAWKEYEDERTGRKVFMNNFSNQNFAMQQYNDMINMNQADIVNRATLSGINIETLQALIRKDYPTTTPEQLKLMTQRAIMDMYNYMEKEAIRQQQMAAAASTFTYPTVSNIGTGSFIDGNVATPAQQQYAMQQQQLHQIMVQREQQANYAKRFGNVRGPALSATATRPPPIVNLQDDNDIIEVPTTPPSTAGPTPSSSVQTPSVSTPVAAENSKRQEE